MKPDAVSRKICEKPSNGFVVQPGKVTKLRNIILGFTTRTWKRQSARPLKEKPRLNPRATKRSKHSSSRPGCERARGRQEIRRLLYVFPGFESFPDSSAQFS